VKFRLILKETQGAIFNHFPIIGGIAEILNIKSAPIQVVEVYA